jgi:hypothetical protein
MNEKRLKVKLNSIFLEYLNILGSENSYFHPLSRKNKIQKEIKNVKFVCSQQQGN